MPTESQPLLADSESEFKSSSSVESRALYRNFVLMCFSFSLNHGCVVSCLAYATTELGDALGGYGSGILYVFYALTALLVAKPIVAMIGPKLGLFCGVFGYCVYIGGFLFSLLLPSLAWPVFLSACAVGGIAGGLLWPSQGKYFARNAALYAEAANLPVDQVNSSFAGLFAASYLGLEMLTKVLATALFLTAPAATAAGVVFSVYALLAVTCAVAVLLLLSELGEQGSWDLQLASLLSNAAGASSVVVSDARLALMLPFQVAFGFASSFVPYYVFGTVIADSSSLGETYVGLLSAVIVLTGSLMALPSSWAANHFGKPVVMCIGGFCLAFSGFAFFFLSDAQLGTWGPILLYLVIYGVGRGTWENTNKAVIADLFVTTPELSTSAFAAVAFFNGFAGAIGYFTFSNLGRDQIATVVFAASLAGIFCYLASAHLHNNSSSSSRKKQQQQQRTDSGVAVKA